MKVIQVPFHFYPDPVGGTEVYVKALSQHLQQQGIETIIATVGEKNESYFHQSLLVYRFAGNRTDCDLRNLYGLGDPESALNFSQILDREQPDLIHLHSFTTAVSIRLIRAAKQRGIPVVFTYHTPTASCLRGTLLHNGIQICDGKLDLYTCTRCTLQGMGLNSYQSRLIGNVPHVVGRSLGAVGLKGGAWTALRMSELVLINHQSFHDLTDEVDHIIAVCDWVKNLLIINKVPQEKITVCRQGLCNYPEEKIARIYRDQALPLKLVFLGRLDKTKGVHLLIQALAIIPSLSVTLDIYGISQSNECNSYQSELINLAQADQRIAFKAPISPTKVVSTLHKYDLLAVPSQWLETGPLVVLEAFAAGVPVLGSRLGGIAELVTDGMNGVLVDAFSLEAWATVIKNLCLDRVKLERLRSNISPPLTMAAVAKQMQSIYQLYM
jgi:glycosyltransferase involved in cell wall biosynthesis